MKELKIKYSKEIMLNKIKVKTLKLNNDKIYHKKI